MIRKSTNIHQTGFVDNFAGNQHIVIRNTCIVFFTMGNEIECKYMNRVLWSCYDSYLFFGVVQMELECTSIFN